MLTKSWEEFTYSYQTKRRKEIDAKFRGPSPFTVNASGGILQSASCEV